jgi:hypothetical protein
MLICTGADLFGSVARTAAHNSLLRLSMFCTCEGSAELAETTTAEILAARKLRLSKIQIPVW